MIVDAGPELLKAGHVCETPAEHHDPAAHSVQSVPWFPYHPGLQVQSSDELLPGSEIEFGGQSTLEVPPVQKALALHFVHSPPSSPKYPGLQEQSVLSSLPRSETE